jgi:arabinose-5-phosphate isomerase
MGLNLQAEQSAVEHLPSIGTSGAATGREAGEPPPPCILNAAALRVLERAAGALRELAADLAGSGGPSFAAALELLAACRGRVVVTGMGKSGLIGRKIAATLASTGCLAHFVHPAEASHGDLGMIGPDDLVLALSNSGETPELADLLAYTAQLAIPLIAITGNAVSTLGRRADVLLLLPAAAEGCALGLAPTTSTSLMLALGDALAVELMERQGFSRGDFRQRHPGGKLGRRLARVEDLIEGAASLPLVHLDSRISEVILVMGRTGYGSAGVIDDHGSLIGMITEADMRRHMGPDLLSLRAGEIMTDIQVTIRPESSPAEALRTMTALHLSNLFVTEGARPIGILHIDDCRRADAA